MTEPEHRVFCWLCLYRLHDIQQHAVALQSAIGHIAAECNAQTDLCDELRREMLQLETRDSESKVCIMGGS